MTAYNTGAFVTSAVESLLAQTYRNIEIIIVDDKSTDDTLKVVRRLCKLDERVKCIALEQNIGTFRAKKEAMSVVGGEFVICHDSDDYSHPEHIERQARPLIDNPSLIATVSQWIRVDEYGAYHSRNIYPIMRLNATSMMFRREAGERLGLWDSVRTGADSEFYARMRLSYGKRAMLRIKMPLMIGTHRSNSLMTSPATGYDAHGVSAVRLAYWESWTRWHIECLKEGRELIMGAQRPFGVPDEIA
jgi:glycosyltransferase involved in cell wall biosynthesis